MLKYKGLWNIVDRSLPALVPTNTQGHLEWTQCDQEAQLQIMTTLNSLLLNYVFDMKTAKEVWDLLRVHYQGNDDLWQHYLLEHLFTITFHDLDHMEPQIADIMAITCQLTDIDFPVLDQLLASAIRVKLPESWDTLKTVLTNTTGGAQTSKGVISQVLAEEHCCVMIPLPPLRDPLLFFSHQMSPPTTSSPLDSPLTLVHPTAQSHACPM
jgi:hypothetical protein